jgi:meso-butanediol dehydrogenase / (S,S)-butanediol dehydrogenase / diacetyl reductase
MRLKDKVAIVTGGGGGLGEGICMCLAREGADVVVSDVNIGLANAVAEKVKAAGRRAIAVKTDVRSPAECQEMVKTALKAMGRIDIMVTNAGVSGFVHRKESTEPPVIESISEEDWNLTVDVNLKGVFLCNQAIAPVFKAQKSGKIVNISSLGGRKGVDFIPHYCATKAGVIVMTQALALQLAPYGVNANTVCPGVIWTPMWEEAAYVLQRSNPMFQGLTPEQVFQGAVQNMIPLKRAQKPEDIGNAVVFLASDEASEITGQALNVDGGAFFS